MDDEMNRKMISSDFDIKPTQLVVYRDALDDNEIAVAEMYMWLRLDKRRTQFFWQGWNPKGWLWTKYTTLTSKYTIYYAGPVSYVRVHDGR